MMDYIAIYREAWNATKKPTQPDYDDLVEEYRNLLAQRAAGAMNGQITDGPFGAFEGKVYDLTRPKSQKPERVTDEPEAKPSEPVKAVKVVPKKTAKKLSATKAATKRVATKRSSVKVIKKAAKKGKK